MWDMTHSCETWLPHLWQDAGSAGAVVVGHENIWDVTCSYATWLLHVRHDSFMWDMTPLCETWLLHVRHDSFICDMAHSYETWLIHMRHDSIIWDMTHSYETWLPHLRRNAGSAAAVIVGHENSFYYLPVVELVCAFDCSIFAYLQCCGVLQSVCVMYMYIYINTYKYACLYTCIYKHI